MMLDKPIRPQPSERWAMYRLICPVVDKACEVSGLEPYFEYSQPNGPNRRLSADIALMQGDQPIWLIEAKKYGRPLHPDLVSAYLREGVMGVVTNGQHWIFCAGGKTLTAGPLISPSGEIAAAVLDDLVLLLSKKTEGAALEQSHPWSPTWAAFPTVAGPAVWRINGGTGSRLFAEKKKFSDLREAALLAQTHVSRGTMIDLFLEEIGEAGREIEQGYLEVSSKRMIWWLPNGKRGARVDLKATQLEILVDKELLERYGRGNFLGSMKLHDKNHGMIVCKASTPAEIRSILGLFGVSPQTSM